MNLKKIIKIETIVGRFPTNIPCRYKNPNINIKKQEKTISINCNRLKFRKIKGRNSD